jgi:HSP20 family protein
MEVAAMLMRTDPFRELDRFAQQVLGTAARPAGMPMDAWREGDQFHVEFDLPGVNPDSLDLDIENNVVTVRADRAPVDPSREMLAAERPRGLFSRQLVLGNNLDTGGITADYRDGVLRLAIPVAEKAKPRKITVSRSAAAHATDETRVITENGDPVHDGTAAKEPVSV